MFAHISEFFRNEREAVFYIIQLECPFFYTSSALIKYDTPAVWSNCHIVQALYYSRKWKKAVFDVVVRVRTALFFRIALYNIDEECRILG